MPPYPSFTQPRLGFENPPSPADLETLLKDRVVERPELLESKESLEVVPPAPSVWLLLPALVLVGLVLSVAPGLVTLFGWPFLGGGRWIVMLLVLWLLFMPALLFAISVAMAKLPSHRPLLRVDTIEHRLVHAARGEEYTEGQMAEFVELSKWAPLEGKWRQLLQWNLLVRDEEDKFTLVPLLTVVDPSLEEVRMVQRLCAEFPCGVTQIPLTLEESQLGARPDART